MRIGVAGLWHLGSVTAACLAQAGFDVVGVDAPEVVAGLAAGRAPLLEPGLDALLSAGLAAGKLRFATANEAGLDAVDVLWVTYDTPVDDEDRADVGLVVARVAEILPLLRDDSVVLVSSQLPAGTTRQMKLRFEAAHPGRRLHFACSPENLRLGKAIAAFTEAERIIIGCDGPEARHRLEPLVARLGTPARWMGLESAEMVKHTINAFLATSVTFINEIAGLCERLGADAAEVEAGIRSEPRIGPRAYVTPGGAFAGGTLARDVTFLTGFGTTHGLPTPLLSGILPSNHQHAGWAFRRISELLGQPGAAPLKGRRVAVLGLTYKAGTSTLRRSTAVELCDRLAAAGAEVLAFDPAVQALPAEMAPGWQLASSAEAAMGGADVLVVATEWPVFRELVPAMVAAAMRQPLVLDQNGFMAAAFAAAPGFRYFRVGKPH